MGAPLDNQTTCQHAGIRFGAEGLDEKFRAIVDELEAAYYQFWRQGLSHPFGPLDVRPTSAQSKRQFDSLHGVLWDLYTHVFHVINQERPLDQRINEDRYRFERDGNGAVTFDKIQNTKDRLIAYRPIRSRG